MAHITVTEAAKLVAASKSTLHRDINKGNISCTTNAKGVRVVDTAELERYYGQLKTPAQGETAQLEHVATPSDDSALVSVLEARIDDLQSQLAQYQAREQRLLTLLETEQTHTKTLMLPKPVPEKRSFLDMFGWLSQKS